MLVIEFVFIILNFYKSIYCLNPDACLKCGRATENIKLRSENHHPAIINGQESDSDSYPWEVLVVQDTKGSKFTCTGSIISTLFLMTAAHCVLNQHPDLKCNDFPGRPRPVCWAPVYNIKASKDRSGEKYPVASYFPHPDMTLPNYHNDIALIRMVNPIQCRYGIAPICLPLPGYNRIHDVMHVAGWGVYKSVHDKGSRKFRKGQMTMVDEQICQNYFGELLEGTFLCAVGNKSKQAICEGDSGSAAFVELEGVNFAIGVTSLFGGEDCYTDKPDLFTKVSYYVPWIRMNVPDLPIPDLQLQLY